MSSILIVHSLASGSSGNSLLIQGGSTNILIDAGLPARTLSHHLLKRGVTPERLHGILLTHEHSDHVQGAGALARKCKSSLIGNRSTLEAYARRDAISFQSVEMPTGEEVQLGDLTVRSFPISHDAAEPVGYRVEYSGSRVAIATDVGCINPSLRDAFQGADLAIIEANHELDWLLRGRYSPEMKARVASDTGHLSNHDCGTFVGELLESNGPCSVWLAHLSRENNTPLLAKRVVSRTIEQLTKTPYRLDVAQRDSPSLLWQVGMQSVQTALW